MPVAFLQDGLACLSYICAILKPISHQCRAHTNSHFPVASWLALAGVFASKGRWRGQFLLGIVVCIALLNFYKAMNIKH
jgi:hypothetical protein